MNNAPPSKVSDKSLIFVVVRTKEGISFKDKVKAVSSYNDKGVFDVLPEHENFISLAKQHLVIHTQDGKDTEIKIDNAIVKVYKNEVHIFLGLTSGQNTTD